MRLCLDVMVSSTEVFILLQDPPQDPHCLVLHLFNLFQLETHFQPAFICHDFDTSKQSGQVCCQMPLI